MYSYSSRYSACYRQLGAQVALRWTNNELVVYSMLSVAGSNAAFTVLSVMIFVQYPSTRPRVLNRLCLVVDNLLSIFVLVQYPYTCPRLLNRLCIVLGK
jgi:hypothetical protein